METVVALIVALIAGGGLYKFFEFLICRKDKKEDKFGEIENTLKRIEKDIKESKQDRCRLQLLNLIYHNPTSIEPIMTVAREYFETLCGDGYVFNELSRWAEEQDVNVDYFKRLHNKNSRRKEES